MDMAHKKKKMNEAAGGGGGESSLTVAVKTLKDFLAGSLAGFCGKLVEYPFDSLYHACSVHTHNTIGTQ